MNKILFLFLFLVTSLTGFAKDRIKRHGIKIEAVVCYASGESHLSFINPPMHLKSGKEAKATILVDYIGFPEEAKQAFQFAVGIWQNLINSPVPIHIKANWVTFTDKNVLGSCRPSDIKTNFNSTQIWNCYYPIALVERMLGEEVNTAGDYEIIANFNKNYSNWYFGTDGNTPANRYDFVSVVLHEMAHGLGFIGNFYSLSGNGGYSSGPDDFPAVFDQCVQNRNGDKLVDTSIFTNPSVKLNQNLTSGWLNFDAEGEGVLPKLFVPSKWDDGSSIYHLDDSTYPSGTENSLMTHATNMGEANHDPGSYTIHIMNEMGWKNISIRHKNRKDVEYVSDPISFDAQIFSDYGLDSAKIFLVYSSTNFIKSDSVLLKATAIPALFNATVNQKLNKEIRYYFSATDVKNKRYVLPSNAPSNFMSFHIGIDNESPVVNHEPVRYLLTTNPTAKIEVQTTDNVGLKSVVLEFFVNGGLKKELPLQNDLNDWYAVTFNLSGLVKSGDLVKYRIVATDNSSQNNIGKSPVTGYNEFSVGGIQNPVDKYVNDFNSVTNDFISPDFSIFKVAGFDSPALNSAHPYLSPDTDNKNFNFTTVLRYPIVLKAGGKMSFDEIVLVEPGEAGAKFGDQEFFDYVIVEGSVDGGVTWKPLVDGYDSGAKFSWKNLFNKVFAGNNSTSVPTKDLFVKREFDLLANGNFNAGDTILVRFRLFSDPYSNGWGWIVDNLSIQDFGTAVDPILLSSGEVSFYPNPANGKLNLQIQAQKNIRQLQLKVYNSLGNMVNSQSFQVESNLFETAIDVSNLLPGLYLFALEPENGQVVTRKILVQ